MLEITPLTPLYLAVSALAYHSRDLLHQHEAIEAPATRAEMAAKIHSESERIFAMLKAGEAANIGQVDGTDGKQLAAELADIAGELESYSRLLADKRSDNLVFLEFEPLCQRAEKAATYLKHLGRSDGRDGHRWVAPTEKPEPLADVQATPDFITVVWHGERLTFTRSQAAIVGLMWPHLKTGAAQSGTYLRDTADVSRERLDLVFRDGHKGYHQAWKRMIVSEKRGTYRLADPSQPLPPQIAAKRPTKKKNRRAGK